MSFPEGPPSDDAQRYATDGRDAEGTSPTASAEDSTTAALGAEDPSASGVEPSEPSGAASSGEVADLDQADRDQTDSGDDKRASTPGGALGPGTTATGAGTSLD